MDIFKYIKSIEIYIMSLPKYGRYKFYFLYNPNHLPTLLDTTNAADVEFKLKVLGSNM